jgi:hypothetical protein
MQCVRGVLSFAWELSSVTFHSTVWVDVFVNRQRYGTLCLTFRSKQFARHIDATVSVEVADTQALVRPRASIVSVSAIFIELY